MFQSFTGSSRKARHVNLSGQNSSIRKGPSANQTLNTANPGSQAAVAQAQAQRLQRGQDRDRLNASRLLQRSWRGHTSRQRTRQIWRAEWDLHEIGRTVPQIPDIGSLIRVIPDEGKGVLAYDSAGECYVQMRLLLHFLDIKLEMDRARLAYFGRSLQRTLEEVPSIATGDSWTLQLYRLSKFTVTALRSAADEKMTRNSCQSESLLSLLLFLSRLIPKYMARSAQRYYSMLARLLSQNDRFPNRLEVQIGEAVLALLTPITSETMTAYVAFGTELLTAPETLIRISGDRVVAPKLNFKMLTAALNRALEDDHATKTRTLTQNDRLLWLLAHLIFLQRHSSGATASFYVPQETEYVKTISALLAAQASEITNRIDLLDEHMDDTPSERNGRIEAAFSVPLPPFVQEQILTLIEKTSIVNMMSQIELTKSSEQETGSDSAQVLATYALTLTRVFPGQRADKIRMWLYDGSAKLKTSNGTPAIAYFWQYSRATAVFQLISNDYHKAVPLLRPFLGLEKSMPAKALASIQQDWRTLLLFLELYFFAIRLMDDEGFLAGGQFGTAGSTHWGAKIRESSLPLKDVRDLVIFLKNLAFALYWNLRDLQEGDDLEQSAGLGAYFGVAASSPAKQALVRSLDTSESSARIHLRDLVTGILRSIHQRE